MLETKPGHSSFWVTDLPITDRQSGDGRVRTDDPLLAKQVLSHLSYAPTVIGHQ